MTTTLDIQRRLLAAGYDVGKAGADGIPGRDTAAAVTKFQVDHGLASTGVVDAATVDALNRAQMNGRPGVAVPPVLSNVPLPWFEEAKRHLGLREVAGPGTNSTIADWLKRLKAGWTDDETAWCGTFVGWCIASTLAGEPLPANPFGARNWLNFGVPCQPRLGAVMVFSRPGTAWSGHVGLYAGESATTYRILGGNQGNAVSYANKARDKSFLGARWPKTVPMIGDGKVAAAAGALSTNEA